MYIRKVLQRRDAASIIVAIILAMIGLNLLSTFSYEPVDQLVEWLGGSPVTNFDGRSWQDAFLAPGLGALAQLVLLEIVLRIFMPVRAALVRRK